MVGTGYVGLVSGTCFAEMGNTVTCVDINSKKIEDLKKGIMPIYEPGLQEMVLQNAASGRLKFATSLAECLDEADVVFSAVGTPPDEDGSADLRYVLDVAREFGRNVKKYTLLITKSTVPVGTWAKVKAAVQEELDKRGVSVPFGVASNPEFLKEGTAIEDFTKPDRVVVGVEDERAAKLMRQLYRPFMLTGDRVQICDIPSAEMIKYAANSMLATRISFMNDIANLCEIVGANVDAVRRGIGADDRIGKKFLYPGCGYGGSCFPKDVKALIRSGAELGYRMRILEAVEEVNERQKTIPFAKLKEAMPELAGKKVVCKTSTTSTAYAESIKDEIGFEIMYVEGSPEMYQTVQSGQADACFEDYSVIAWAIKQGSVELKTVGKVVNEGYYGFAVKKGTNPELIEKFNAGLKNIKESGKYAEILAKYGYEA